MSTSSWSSLNNFDGCQANSEQLQQNYTNFHLLKAWKYLRLCAIYVMDGRILGMWRVRRNEKERENERMKRQIKIEIEKKTLTLDIHTVPCIFHELFSQKNNFMPFRKLYLIEHNVCNDCNVHRQGRHRVRVSTTFLHISSHFNDNNLHFLLNQVTHLCASSFFFT